MNTRGMGKKSLSLYKDSQKTAFFKNTERVADSTTSTKGRVTLGVV